MVEKQQGEKEIKYEVNLQFINQVRENVIKDPKTQTIAIIQRTEDVSIFTTNEDENVLLSFSS
jgi:hypothetical protein